MKLEDAKATIQRTMVTSKSPAFLCSFQKDSLLLLFLLREMNFDPTILWFHDHTPKQAERVITEWDLTVFSYGPACRYKVENSVVSEYSIGSARLPVIQDIGEEGHELTAALTPYFNYGFDATFFGYKVADKHELVSTVFEPEFELGPTRMVAPLYHFTDDEVLQMIEDFQIPYEPFSDDVIDSDLPVVPLPTFRQRFSL